MVAGSGVTGRRIAGLRSGRGALAALLSAVSLVAVISSPADAASKSKSKKKVETVFLVCDETGDHNYTLRRKTGGEKLKLSKYSPRLRKHTMHTEKKK